MKYIFQTWDDLEGFVEEQLSNGANSMTSLECPTCSSIVQIQVTESKNTAKISCKSCDIETIICGISNANK